MELLARGEMLFGLEIDTLTEKYASRFGAAVVQAAALVLGSMRGSDLGIDFI